MGADLHVINKLWYLTKEEVPGDVIEDLDYFTVLAVGTVLLRHPEIAQQFINEAWTKTEEEE